MQAILTRSTGGRSRAAEHARRRRLPRVRIVALVLLGALGCTVAGLGQAGAAGGGREPVVSPADVNGRRAVVVAPGDTLWAIAVRHAPADLDPRYAVYLLRSFNDLDSALLQVGQKLRLPSGWPGPH